MADRRWESGAAAVAQVNTYVFANTWEADDVVRLIAGNKKKDFTTGSATIATFLATLDPAIDALDDADYPEITGDESGVTATSNATTLTLTANEPGVPFTISLTPLESDLTASGAGTIEGGTTATTGTVATANAGPNVFGTVYNWSGDTVPVDGDTVYLENTDASILYDLDQSAIEPAALYVFMSYTGFVGLPKLNQLGTEYPEYRADYLTIGPAILDVGRGEGTGSGRLKFDSGTDTCAVTVHNTGSPEEPGIPALLWKGTHASNTFTARGNASCGIAFFGGESATVATLSVGGSAEVVCGIGCTLTTVNVDGQARLTLNSNVGGTLTQRGGEVTVNGSATAAQLTLRGGRLVYNSTGTISGNTVLSGDAVLDFSQGVGAVTVSNPIELYGPNCRIIDPNKRVVSLVVDFNESAGQDQVEWGSHVRLTRATPA